MILFPRILQLLLSLPPCWVERADPDRIAHLTIEAQAIAAVSVTADDAAGLVAILEAESAGCWSVATGTRRGGEGQGPWQLEPNSNREPPFFGDTVEPLTHAAGEALWIWKKSRRCGKDLGARFGYYAGLGCRAWSGSAKRVKRYQWARNRLAHMSQ